MSRFLPYFLAVCVAVCSGAKLPLQDAQVLKEAPEEVIFRAGKPELVLECATEDKSQAPIRYSWFKNGQLFEPSGEVSQRDNEGTLVFKNPKKDDEGKYQCFAQTEAGTASTRIINVKLAFIDIPKVTLQNHKPIEGKVYQLDCEIPNSYPKPEIQWIYQSVSDPSISRNILDKRITLSPNGVLYFSNVTKEDTSADHKYVCVAKTPAHDGDVILAEHVMEDVQPSSGSNSELVLQYVSNDIIGQVGKVTMIYCIYGGTPLAHPDWYKDGKNVNNSPKDRVTRYNRTAGKRLLIKETWLEDEGNYTCIVDNEVGKPQEHTISVRVVSAPEFTKKPEPKDSTVSGRDVTIPCQVAALPVAKITWTYNAKSLPENDKLVISQTTQGNITVADLTIKNVQNSDTGYYGCRATNQHGDIYAETLLIVQ
ncbi:hemolin-like [Danaus plexippus]|uniref:hemolin-like n=1 Tax=Danaus plexippus TaxID=13037 RepID=UPI002AB27363|nr:hemolin-like [Danaus plexippus]